MKTLAELGAKLAMARGKGHVVARVVLTRQDRKALSEQLAREHYCQHDDLQFGLVLERYDNLPVRVIEKGVSHLEYEEEE